MDRRSQSRHCHTATAHIVSESGEGGRREECECLMRLDVCNVGAGLRATSIFRSSWRWIRTVKPPLHSMTTISSSGLRELATSLGSGITGMLTRRSLAAALSAPDAGTTDLSRCGCKVRSADSLRRYGGGATCLEGYSKISRERGCLFVITF